MCGFGVLCFVELPFDFPPDGDQFSDVFGCDGESDAGAVQLGVGGPAEADVDGEVAAGSGDRDVLGDD